MNLKLFPVLCAASLALQPPAATAAPATPDDPGKVNLHPALIVEEGIGEVVVYVSDDFRRSTPFAAEPLDVITIQRVNPGDASTA
jgi:hypothetical protein